MKRFSDGNMGGPYKRSRMGPDDVEVRLLIPSKVAGSIIGKGGKNISRLRADYKASVTVPDCPGPERILTVCSSEVDTIIKVISEVVPNLEDTSGRSKNGDDVDIRMLVHQSQAGCIIGKGGLKVKELREKTGARIKIYTNCCPESTDRVVQITGRGNTCTACIQEMLELLKSVPVKGVDNQYDPIHFDDVYADEYGGYGQGGGGGGGRGGMMGRDMGPPMGRDMGGRDMGSRGGRPSPFGGGPPSRGVGMGGGGPPPRSSSGFGGSGGGGGSGFGGGGPGNGFEMEDEPLMGLGMGGGLGMRNNRPGPGLGLGPNRNGPGPDRSGSGQAQVTIPKDLAGAIIGKAGDRIRKIRMESGAGITIEEPLPGSNDRIITISGQPNQIQMAQYLLQQSVHENTNVAARNNRY